MEYRNEGLGNTPPRTPQEFLPPSRPQVGRQVRSSGPALRCSFPSSPWHCSQEANGEALSLSPFYR